MLAAILAILTAVPLRDIGIPERVVARPAVKERRGRAAA